MERQLEEKGYRYIKDFGYDNQEAKEYAKSMRDRGYKARVLSYSIMIRGIREYAVWAKSSDVRKDR